MQPTQPLVQAWHIDEAIEQMHLSKKSVLGVSRHDVHPILLRTMHKNRTLFPILPHRSSTLRRQEMEDIYCVNGMLYINRAQEVLENPMISLNDNICGYEIDPMYYVDIDTLEDIDGWIERIEKLKHIL